MKLIVSSKPRKPRLLVPIVASIIQNSCVADDYFWVKLSPEGPHLIVSDRLESMDFCMDNMKGKEGIWTGIYEKAAEHGHIMMKAVIRQKNILEFHMFVKTARVGDW